MKISGSCHIKKPIKFFSQNEKASFYNVFLGAQLRQIHLLESSVVEKYITQYQEDGNTVVEKI